MRDVGDNVLYRILSKMAHYVPGADLWPAWAEDTGLSLEWLVFVVGVLPMRYRNASDPVQYFLANLLQGLVLHKNRQARGIVRWQRRVVKAQVDQNGRAELRLNLLSELPFESGPVSVA